MSEREGRFIIDAICRNKDTVRVIEVETQLGMDHYSGIGQALVYAYVYKKENPDKTVIPTIVCVFVDEDFLKVCKNYGIEVHYCEVGGIGGW
jgi:hypothetical protein